MALEDIRAERIKKLEALKARGINPYPAETRRPFRVETILQDFKNFEGSAISVVGRLTALREHGGATFGDLEDESGKIQVLLKEDILGERYELAALLDIGDFIQVEGRGITTKRGEKTIEASGIAILAKSLRPLPEKWHGLVDIEERLRRRYLDLLMDPEERELFRKKSKFWQSIRKFLLNEGFLEVETPVLEQIPGGADAEPFKTHMHALDIGLYLRISLELYQKRLLVGGYEKVFEIGRIFRNEGIDREHLQDYTQMEFYWAYANFEQGMDLVERMYREVIQETFGTTKHMAGNAEIDWGRPWKRIDYYEVFRERTGIDLGEATELALKDYAESQGIDTKKHPGRGRLIDIIYKKMVRPHFVEPAFLILPPADVSPLAKRWPGDSNRAERFQPVAGGTELGNGYSELNDPLDQRARFEEQERLRASGDTEAQRMDEDFVEALEYGMPPACGFGVSERLFSFILGKPMRELVFFPLMRPRAKE